MSGWRGRAIGALLSVVFALSASHVVATPSAPPVHAAIIVVSDTGSIDAADDFAANSLWVALAGLGIPPDNILYLSPNPDADPNRDKKSDVDGSPTLKNLQEGIEVWAPKECGANVLSVFLVGTGSDGCFQLNKSEILSPFALDESLDVFQDSTSRVVHVSLDFPEAGRGIGVLIPPSFGGVKAPRFAMACAGKNEPVLRSPSGQLSFSSIVAAELCRSNGLGSAFAYSYGLFKVLSNGEQMPLLDADGDGTPNGVGDDANAAKFSIGSSPTSRPPSVASVTVPDVVPGREPVAVSVKTEDKNTSVRCVFLPVTGDPDNLHEIVLSRIGTSHAGTCDLGISPDGAWRVLFLPVKTSGALGRPVMETTYRADRYEYDDVLLDANPLSSGFPQVHNLHVSGDKDWVKLAYEPRRKQVIEIKPLGTNFTNPVVELTFWPYGASEPSTSIVPIIGTSTSYIILDDVLKPSPGKGVVYACVMSAGAEYGEGSEYEIVLSFQSAPTKHPVLVLCAFEAGTGNRAPAGCSAKVVFPNGESKVYPIAVNAPHVVVDDQENSEFGLFTVTLSTDAGYLAREDPLVAGAVQNPASEYGNPHVIHIQNDTNAVVAHHWVFLPYVKVEGSVFSSLNQAPVPGAKLVFRPADPPAENSVWPAPFHSAYPPKQYAPSYAQPWIVGQDGKMPANVFLPPGGWHLDIELDGQTVIINNAFREVMGQTKDLKQLNVALAVPIPQTISFPESGEFPGNTVVPLNATASSGLPVEYRIVSGPGVLNKSDDETVLTFTNVGAVVVEAFQDGDPEKGYLAADPVRNDFTALAVPQAVYFVDLAAPQVFDSTQDLNAKPDGQHGAGATTFDVLEGPGEIVDGNRLRATSGTGTITVRATLAADGVYTEATTTAQVECQKAPAQVSLSDLQAVYSGQSQGATAQTTPDNLSVEMTYDGQTIPPVDAGIYTVVATIVDANYTGGAQEVLTIARAPQAIVGFVCPETARIEDELALIASSDCGLPVGFSAKGPGSIENAVLRFTDRGEVEIKAANEGNGNYLPASMTRTLRVLGWTTSGTPEWWLLEKGISDDKGESFDVLALKDPDGDGFPTWQEYLADTDPLNSSSHLHVVIGVPNGDGQVDWLAGPESWQVLEWAPFPGAEWSVVYSNAPGAQVRSRSLSPLSSGVYRVRAGR